MRKAKGDGKNGVKDFRHKEAKRWNNPPVGLAPTYEVRERKTNSYQYDPSKLKALLIKIAEDALNDGA